MPAAEMGRLRVQINGIIDRFADPLAFCSGLRDLLDQYANRAYRAGQAAPPQSLLPSYRVAPLIMRELEMMLGKACQAQPDLALDILDALWQDPSLEPRLLATTLLGLIPASHNTGVIQKLHTWATPEENFRMLEALFKNGTVELRRSHPELMLALIDEWMNDPHLEVQALGLRALVPLIGDRSFENLPPVFRLLAPLVQNIPTRQQPDVLAAVDALIQRSPTETAYFLRQALSLASGPATARLIRRCLPSFEPAQQASLRAALQSASTSL